MALVNVEKYGRIDKKRKMRLGLPDYRHGFNVKNKLSFKHFRNK